MTQEEYFTKNKDITITEQLSAFYKRAKNIASNKVSQTADTINREIRIAALSQERKKLIIALGEKTYSRIKGKTDEPYAVRLETIDHELATLTNNK